MKMMLIKLMMLISTLIPLLKNPMSMGLILMFQTMIAILYINLLVSSSWFSMITFLMMIGGLLILIMYMNSIASNEKFKININMIIMIMVLMNLTDEFMSENLINEKENMINKYNLSMSIMKIFNMKSMYITMMLVIYLLLTMISVSKTVKFNEGPLRMFNYE
nr:NADH dehydrogenase subunit 6 [Jacobiasca formosana]UER93877.1 NADH dehydrogenase subunit 6 [Jacobiasca formosana]